MAPREILARSHYGKREKLADLRSLIDARGKGPAQKILDSVGLKRRTLFNWLADPDKIETAHLASTDLLDRALEALTASVPLSHSDYYRYVLSQMNRTSRSQDTTRDYDGTYDLFHNISPSALKFGALHLRSNDRTRFPLFVIVAFSSGRKRLIAEGFVYTVGDYIFMSSASEYLTASLVLTREVNVRKNIMQGVMNVYDGLQNYSYVSSIAICHEDYRAGRLEGLSGDALNIRNQAIDEEIRKQVGTINARL